MVSGEQHPAFSRRAGRHEGGSTHNLVGIVLQKVLVDHLFDALDLGVKERG